MNFQNESIRIPLKVVVSNPLAPASQLILVKILSGVIFSKDQPIDLKLLLSSEKKACADALKIELESCAFSCCNSIKVIFELPGVCDGDVFCFITNFTNPNCFKFDKEILPDEIKILDFIIKIASNFNWHDEAKSSELDTKYINSTNNQSKMAVHTGYKPIIMTDSLLAMDILHLLSKNMPSEIFFCPSPIPAIAKSVLADYINVQCNAINDVLVWAANDEVFHVEVEKPLIINDFQCKLDTIETDLKSLNLDSTQFSAAWMKKEFIEKVASSATKNPYGCIYRAAEFSKTLRDIWLTRIMRGDVAKVYTNIGVISDGSLGTIKAYPYFLPIVQSYNMWSVDTRFEDDTHLRMEIKRLNKTAQEQHTELISYCKKFLQETVIYQAFTDEDDIGSTSKY